ncbi:hypothetical protein J3Q64DRAFT_1823384 [Phycomyces blakesleeanus]|uniref:Uncharacterized protein n=1 Tax=Phycomyces blakesleeanus TaxID=4837 RepID=A0ABR3ASU4_PHYBL
MTTLSKSKDNTFLIHLVTLIFFFNADSGESTNPYTQFMRQMQYKSNKKVFGLKIDMRFVLTLTRIDMDIDARKLLVEAKNIFNGLFNSIHDIKDVREISGAGIQVGGLTGQTLNLHLYKPKTYVTVPNAKLGIPSNICLLVSFAETFEILMASIIGRYGTFPLDFTMSLFSNHYYKSMNRNAGTIGVVVLPTHNLIYAIKGDYQ